MADEEKKLRLVHGQLSESEWTSIRAAVLDKLKVYNEIIDRSHSENMAFWIRKREQLVSAMNKLNLL